MSIRSDNLNLNLNLNLGASGATGGATGYGRARFNTEDMDKLMPAPPPATLPLPTKQYAEDWQADLRAWAYVCEFMTAIPWGNPPVPAPPVSTPPLNNRPILFMIDRITKQAGFGSFPVPDKNAARALDPAEMANQATLVVNASLDRADRALEILDQATAPGAINYWTGLIRIDPSQEKNSFLLLQVALKIGEYVAMGLKGYYRMRRPSQVYPYILPIIDPPDTPSFPSSHSLQSHLISNCLIAALTPRFGPGGLVLPSQTAIALEHLAHRVARNREVAGVHYPMDSACGAFVAQQCIGLMQALPANSLFQTLLAQARTELVDLP
jgi:hypothetical protein